MKVSRKAWRRGTAGLALVLAAGLLLHLVGGQLPVLPRQTTPHLVGAFHLHSAASHDSRLTLAELVAQARQLGLDFLVLTDHNAQPPTPPELNGVTLLGFAELSTRFGHTVQFGATSLLPAWDRDDVQVHARVRAAGGSSWVTHPSDRKRPWNGPWEAAGGLEIANFASAARRAAEPLYLGILPVVMAYPLNPGRALAALYDRDGAALALWDAQPDPAFVGLCGSDTHGWIDLGLNLRTWSLVVPMEGTYDGCTGGRGATIARALRAGQFYCSAGLYGLAPGLDFTAQAADGRFLGGAGASLPRAGLARLRVAHTLPAALPVQIVLRRSGQEVARSSAAELLYANPTAGTYRVEVSARVPRLLGGSRWLEIIYSNRLRVLP